MSFMFNPHPYDDPTPVNKPNIEEDTINSIVSSNKDVAEYLSNTIKQRLKNNSNQRVILALDGYISAQFDPTVNLIVQNLNDKSFKLTTIDFSKVFKSSDQLNEELSQYLYCDKEKDPVSLFGKLYEQGYLGLIDNQKLAELNNSLNEIGQNDYTKNEIFIVYGCGCTISPLRNQYDIIVYFDVTPKEVILRCKKGAFKNIGDIIARPLKETLRRCYYIDFEAASHLRRDLILNDVIDFYVISNDPENIKLIPREALNSIMSAMVKYPLRCKPVYVEGVWGGQFIKKVRGLPDTLKNCAWVFDLIPLEVSIVVLVGKHHLEFPFFTFVQKEGNSLMGEKCTKLFNGYFPIRFNYDDSYHSSGNMSIQVHSGHEYNIKNYNELGRQDESYYIVATGHEARTYVGFNENINPDDFMREAKISEKEYTPIDYMKYVNHISSNPGLQVLLPAGTIHSSGRNQVVLEIGSLTVGSYTYKLYDYLRKDLDGKPRPIHTHHGEKVLQKERKTNWVKENLIQAPRLLRKGNNWAEYIIGDHELLYFRLHRLEFYNKIEDDTEGKFHVLSLIDGEEVIIESIDNPDYHFIQRFLDVVIVPAKMGKYIIKNLGNQPVFIHKTLLK